ncbi:MAG: glutathione S-transferase family protein [Sedimentitalea sp.]
MADYTLFCAPDTYALCAHVMLEELGVDYDVRWVELFSDTPDPAFLAASPHCRTPALATPEGTIFETGAVCLYLAERDPQSRFVIAPADPRRGAFLQWFHYLATSLQPEVIIQFHPEFYHPDAATQDMLKASSMTRLHRVFQTLNSALADGPYFFGQHPTVPDIVLGTQTIWDEIFPKGDISAYPNLARHRSALCARPAVHHVLKLHQTRRAQS